MEERSASSVAEYIDQIKDIRQIWNPDRKGAEEIWFRGVSQISHSLLPGVYRVRAARYDYDEGSLFETFKSLAAGFASRPPANEWEWYFLAQHHGLPTRLLDWTENALAAVYFALLQRTTNLTLIDIDGEMEKESSESPRYDNAAVVWMLDAGSLNSYAFGESYDLVFTPGGDITNRYLPTQLWAEEFSRDDPELGARMPIAIYPYRANERIIAQQGTFTVHGAARVALEELEPTKDGYVPRLARIFLAENRVAHLLDELLIAGVHRMSLFPDYDNVAEHVRWLFE